MQTSEPKHHLWHFSRMEKWRPSKFPP